MGARRDYTRVALTQRDLAREEIDDPDYPGIPVDSPRRRELQQVMSGVTRRRWRRIGPETGLVYRGKAEGSKTETGDFIGALKSRFLSVVHGVWR